MAGEGDPFGLKAKDMEVHSAPVVPNVEKRSAGNPFGLKSETASPQEPAVQETAPLAVRGKAFGLSQELPAENQAEEAARQLKLAQERRTKLMQGEIPISEMTEGERAAFLLKKLTEPHNP